MILVDAGPLVAWLDARDPDHGRCVDALKGIREPMGTVWPALAEALLVLRDEPKGRDALLEILKRGVVRVVALGQEDVPRIQELMSRYQDQAMDLADAALVRVAERDGWVRVFTLDRRAFEAYRIGRRKRFLIIPVARPRRSPGARRPKARGGRGSSRRA